MNNQNKYKLERLIEDQGFGTLTQNEPARLVNKDGTFNVRHKNRKNSISRGYHYLVSISWTKFFLIMISIYVGINLVFGFVYKFCGIEEITQSTGTFWGDVWNGFFFSAQTITTVGYGGMSPTGPLANWISSFEAFLGLLLFSFVTGILYGRFSKPEASIKFSKSIIYRPFKEGHAIMFRLMNRMPTVMIQPSVTVSLAKQTKNDDGTWGIRYYQLKLQINKVNFLPSTWTIVHEIDEESPFFEMSESDIKEMHAEFLIMVQYFDETYDQTVYQVTSYLSNEMEFNVKFIKAYYIDDDGVTVLDHNLLSAIEPM